MTSRALEGMILFKDARDYEVYLQLLQAYQERFGFKLFAYVLLPDHLHLCVELTNNTTISTIMHALNSRYTKAYNKRYGHAGHVFQERFKLTLIEKAPSLLQVTGYLHTHPRRDGLIEDLSGYRWSSYHSYLAGDTSRPGLCSRGEVAEVLEQLNREQPGWTYDQCLLSVRDAEWDQLRVDLQRPVLGSEEFVAFVERRRRELPRRAEESTVGWKVEGGRGKGEEKSTHASSRFSSALTVSLAVAFLSLCAAGLYAKNMTALKQTMRVLTQERRLLISGLADLVQETPNAQLAAYSSPMRLNGVSLEVEVRPASAARAADLQKDRLDFRAGTMTSRELAAQGFLPSKYTLTYQKNGAVIWEAMQTDRAGTILTWRGEWDGQVMHGLMIRETPGKAPAQFNFVGATQPQRTQQPTSET